MPQRPVLPIVIAVIGVAACGSPRTPLTKEQLGRAVFMDPALSETAGQSCNDCHDVASAFSDPEGDRSSAGAIRERFGIRNAQTAMYSGFIPPLRHDPASGRYTGGLFWDGRADTLEAQAALPLLNPIEMNNPSKAAVVEKVRRAPYAQDFRNLFGPRALDDVETAFAHVTEVLGAFQRTHELAPFASKYDRYLAGNAALTPEEQRGLAIFEDPARGNCAGCHPNRPGSDGKPPLFTDFSYANLGIPKWKNSPFYSLPAAFNPDGRDFIDRGLMKTVGGDPAYDGVFRVPTLRNVARTGPYGHNGYFQTLQEVVLFLDARTVVPCGKPTAPSYAACAAPEVPTTVDTVHFGKQRLSPQDVDDLIAFLHTLTDGEPR